MVQAARANGTVFQVGSPQRFRSRVSQSLRVRAQRRIGKLRNIRATLGGGPSCGWQAPQEPPAGLDWNFWLGPARWAEYIPLRCHHEFRWFYDYSGGKMTDWGAHHNDIAQWGNGTSETGPVKIEPISVRFPPTASMKRRPTFTSGPRTPTVSRSRPSARAETASASRAPTAGSR